MLTLEDLMEEICGNIEDEHDTQKLIARQIEQGIYEFSGRCEIAEINDRFHLDIPEDDSYQTLAGYILTTTGSIPAQGQILVAGQYRFDILKKAPAAWSLSESAHKNPNNNERHTAFHILGNYGRSMHRNSRHHISPAWRPRRLRPVRTWSYGRGVFRAASIHRQVPVLLGAQKKDNKDSLSYGRLTAILALNIIGCAAMTLVSDPSGFIVDPGAIVGKRIADGWFESGIRSIPCGFIMTLSVRSARSGLWWPLIFGVPSFIICSFPHCVADIFYYAACAPSLSASDWVALAGVYPATVVGNYLGCNIYRSFSPKRQH